MTTEPKNAAGSRVTYREPLASEVGLIVAFDGTLFTNMATGDTAVWEEDAGFWTSDEGGRYATRGDALVAWCLATGRRHLCVVPEWSEWSCMQGLGGRMHVGEAVWWPGEFDAPGCLSFYDPDDGWLPGRSGGWSTRTVTASIEVADEIEARWTVAVLTALKEGL